MNRKLNSHMKITASVLVSLLLLGIAVGTASAATASASIRAYGDEDVGPGTNINNLENSIQNGYGPRIYNNVDDVFNPTAIEKDSITMNPAIIPWDAIVFKMSAGQNIDEKKFMRMWYEPNHTYNGIRNNPTYHPTIELETTYMLIDSKEKQPVAGQVGYTKFALPVAKTSGQIGLGSFSGNGDLKADLVDLVSATYIGPNTNGTIRIQTKYTMNPGDSVQFLDHRLTLLDIYSDPNDINKRFAHVEVSYAGNSNDDSASELDLTTDPTFFDRHNFDYSNPAHPDRTWYAQLVGLTSGGGAYIIVGKEISAGDTFYVNSERYDVPAVFVPSDGWFKFITLRSPLPKGNQSVPENSVVTSQIITEIPPNTSIPVNPPFNGKYNMVDDTNVVLWEPNAHPDEWPTGPFPEGERYLTQRDPNPDWKNYFEVDPIMVLDTNGRQKWIADEVNGRIIYNVDKLNFTYRSEDFEQRYSTDLLEILKETTPETWTKYVIQTRPDQYTEFILPPRPDVVMPPAGRSDLDDAYMGDYLVTTSFIAPESESDFSTSGLGQTCIADELGATQCKFGRAAFSFDPENGLDPYVNRLTDPLLRIYGADDEGIRYGEDNSVNPRSVEIYKRADDPFNPAMVTKDSITFNPAIIPWDGQNYKMSAGSTDVDIKKFLRMWYEPNHTYNGIRNNPTNHPTIELESSYMLIDSKHKEPIAGPERTTIFAFPIAETPGQIGLGSFNASGDNNGMADLVTLADVDVGSAPPTTDGRIRVQKTFNLRKNQQVQFLDHKLTFLEITGDPSDVTKAYANVRVEYAGNLVDDYAREEPLGTVAGDPKYMTWFDRHDFQHLNPDHPETTWYAKLEYFSPDLNSAQITVGKEIWAGDTFYVNSVRNDVRAVFVINEPAPNGEPVYKFKYITISTPLPKAKEDVEVSEQSTVSSQSITTIPPNYEIPVNPPFNGVYNMVDDINVILWEPTDHITEWPTGPFPDGERYLTVQVPPQDWSDYFKVVKALVKDTEGNNKWIAYEVNGRIIKESKLSFTYVDENFERRYSTDLLEILNEQTTPESWKWNDIRTLPDQYTEFKLPPRHDLKPKVRPDVEQWGDYLVTLNWFAPNSPPEHNLDQWGGKVKRAAFAYDPVDSTGIYVNEIADTPPPSPVAAPIVNINANSPVHALDTVTADPAGTNSPDGTPLTLTYNWGDGTPDTVKMSVQKAYHQYNAKGFYTITLTVTDGTNTVSNHTVVEVLDDGVKISFKKGWNQISVPVTNSSKLGVLLADVPGITSVWSWNGAMYVPATGSAPDKGKGYFVFATMPADIIIRGTAYSWGVSDVQGSLILPPPSWTMVGPGFSNIVLPGTMIAYTYNPGTGLYDTKSTLLPGVGYWIHNP